MLNFEYFGADGMTSSQGIFIPIASLPGVKVNELLDESSTKDSVITLAILSKLAKEVAFFNPLGLTVSKPLPIIISADVWNQTYVLNTVLMANYTNNLLSPIPAPITGSNEGLGNLLITSIFPGALKLAAGVATGGAGVLIPAAETANYGAIPHAGIDLSADGRGWLFALVSYVVNNAAKRLDNGRSAVLSASKSANSIFTPPASFVSVDNPLSGVLAIDLPLRAFLSTTYNIVVQLKLDQDNQTFDVNVLDS